MKQFHCPNLGRKLYTYDEIRDQFQGTIAAIQDLEVGESAIDCDQDLGVRKADVEGKVLQDVGQTSTARFLDAVATARAPGERDERLERIALEYVRILLPAHINGLQLDCTVAEAAVRNAKALIAELDKQA